MESLYVLIVLIYVEFSAPLTVALIKRPHSDNWVRNQLKYLLSQGVA